MNKITINKVLRRLEKKLVRDLQLLEKDHVETCPNEELDQSELELQIFQIKEMISVVRVIVDE